VEANPSLPLTQPSGGGVTATSSVTNADVDTQAPVTSLAVIDILENSALFASGGVTDAQLAAGREWYLTNAPRGIETEEKRTALKRFARPLQKLRTGIEARAKEFTGETKRKLALIDTEKRRLVQIVGGIEDEVLKPLTEWEQEEESRKVRLAGIVRSLGEHVVTAVYPSIASLEETIAELESFDVSTMQEYKVGAESAIAASLKVLKPELERRKVAEANERELAELRRKQAERDRQDEIAREAERIANEKIAKLQPTPVSTDTAPREMLITDYAVQGFHSPAAIEAQREYAEVEASNVGHVEQVHEAIITALVTHTWLNHGEAENLIDTIAKGLIPHVTINY
jgi:colicin import membrane protein